MLCLCIREREDHLVLLWSVHEVSQAFLERGESRLVLSVFWLFSWKLPLILNYFITVVVISLWSLSKTFENLLWFYTFHCPLVTKKSNLYYKNLLG